MTDLLKKNIEEHQEIIKSLFILRVWSNLAAIIIKQIKYVKEKMKRYLNYQEDFQKKNVKNKKDLL